VCGIIRRILKGTHFDAVLEYIFYELKLRRIFAKRNTTLHTTRCLKITQKVQLHRVEIMCMYARVMHEIIFDGNVRTW